MVETNPGPGLGILLAYTVFGRGITRASAPGAAVIHFFGGIHEIYFPYVLMKPALLLAAIAGGASGLFTATIFNAGLLSTPAPGSIIAYMALTPRGGFVGVILAVLVATAVSFLVASVIIRASSSEVDNEEGLAAAAGQMETMKGKKSSVTGTLAGSRSGNGSTNGATNGSTDGDTATATPETGSEDDFDYAQVNKIIFACDAGMGSSAMGASLLKNKAKKAGLTDIEVKNTAINQIPDDADVVITHKDLTDRARNKLPGARHVSVDNFLGSPKYDELIDEISTSRV
jgi:PTS system mannitol-specific IIC component